MFSLVSKWTNKLYGISKAKCDETENVLNKQRRKLKDEGKYIWGHKNDNNEVCQVWCSTILLCIIIYCPIQFTYFLSLSLPLSLIFLSCGELSDMWNWFSFFLFLEHFSLKRKISQTIELKISLVVCHLQKKVTSNQQFNSQKKKIKMFIVL